MIPDLDALEIQDDVMQVSRSVMLGGLVALVQVVLVGAIWLIFSARFRKVWLGMISLKIASIDLPARCRRQRQRAASVAGLDKNFHRSGMLTNDCAFQINGRLARISK